MSIKSFFENNTVSKVIFVLAALLVILVFFQAGIFVGLRRENFACRWNGALSSDLDDPRSILSSFIRRPDGLNPHGVVGTIISTQLPFIMIKELDNSEVIVGIGSTTAIRNLNYAASTSDLVAGRQVVVIGRPDDNGRIEAILIRLLPQMMQNRRGSTTPERIIYQ